MRCGKHHWITVHGAFFHKRSSAIVLSEISIFSPPPLKNDKFFSKLKNNKSALNGKIKRTNERHPTTMIRIAICDNDIAAADTLEASIKTLAAAHRTKCEIHCFASGPILALCYLVFYLHSVFIVSINCLTRFVFQILQTAQTQH